MYHNNNLIKKIKIKKIPFVLHHCIEGKKTQKHDNDMCTYPCSHERMLCTKLYIYVSVCVCTFMKHISPTCKPEDKIR